MMSALMKVAPGFIFGAGTITILKLMYGPTGWNVLTMLAILTAYFVGRLVSEMGKERESFLLS